MNNGMYLIIFVALCFGMLFGLAMPVIFDALFAKVPYAPREIDEERRVGERRKKDRRSKKINEVR